MSDVEDKEFWGKRVWLRRQGPIIRGVYVYVGNPPGCFTIAGTSFQ